MSDPEPVILVSRAPRWRSWVLPTVMALLAAAALVWFGVTRLGVRLVVGPAGSTASATASPPSLSVVGLLVLIDDGGG